MNHLSRIALCETTVRNDILLDFTHNEMKREKSVWNFKQDLTVV